MSCIFFFRGFVFLLAPNLHGPPQPQAAVVPACICILDGFVATNLVDSEDCANFNSVLRWLSAQCTLATVRRFLMPASVNLDSEGNYVLCRASGCHWVFLDVCVETDDIAVHDWVKLPHSKYTTLARPFQAHAGVIRSEKTVKQCLGVKRTYNS